MTTPDLRGEAQREEQAEEEQSRLAGEDDPSWRQRARCRDGQASLTELFFSDDAEDIAAAKEFCAECPVRVACLRGALVRREPWGVWGGQLFWKGQVVAQKRRQGRPPLPRDPETGEVVRDPARVAELRARARRLPAEVEELIAASA